MQVHIYIYIYLYNFNFPAVLKYFLLTYLLLKSVINQFA